MDRTILYKLATPLELGSLLEPPVIYKYISKMNNVSTEISEKYISNIKNASTETSEKVCVWPPLANHTQPITSKNYSEPFLS